MFGFCHCYAFDCYYWLEPEFVSISARHSLTACWMLPLELGPPTVDMKMMKLAACYQDETQHALSESLFYKILEFNISQN